MRRGAPLGPARRVIGRILGTGLVLALVVLIYMIVLTRGAIL